MRKIAKLVTFVLGLLLVVPGCHIINTDTKTNMDVKCREARFQPYLEVSLRVVTLLSDIRRPKAPTKTCPDARSINIIMYRCFAKILQSLHHWNRERY